jgi:trk system potassium uptake protein TrkA
VSITATLIVKEGRDSQVRQVIARATSTLHERMLQRVGADRVVFPSRMQGSRLGRELVRPNLLERLRLDDSNGIEEITVPPAFVGQSLRDLNLRRNHQVTVLAAGPANRLTFNPPASTVLGQGELLVVMGSYKALEALPSA